MSDSFDDYCENCSTNPGVIPTNDEFKRNVQQALCAIVGGGGGGGAATQFFLYQDSEGTPFIAVRTEGTPDTMEFYELDGVTPFVPVGDYEPYCCPSSGSAGTQEIIPLCDADSGAVNQFLRIYTIDSLGAITYEDKTLAGADYTPVGDVGICEVAVGLYQPTSAVTLCDNDGGVITPFNRFFFADTNDGAAAGVVDVGLDGNPYTITGTVELCCCEASGGAFQEDQVFLSSAPFENTRFFTDSNGGGGGAFEWTMYPNGNTDANFSGVFASRPLALICDETYTNLLGVVGSVSGSQNLVPVDIATEVAGTPIPITGISGTTVIRQLFRNYATGDTWAYGSNGAVRHLYIIDLATGVCTLQGRMLFLPIDGQFGLAFTESGMLVVGIYATAASYLSEVIQVANSTTYPPSTFELGPTIYGYGQLDTGPTTGYPFYGPIAYTAAKTLLAASTLVSSRVGEFDLYGNEIMNNIAQVSTGSSAIAYYNNLRNDRLFAGAPLRRVTELDATGAVVSTQYFDTSGTDVTALIEPGWVLTQLTPQLARTLGEANETQAQHQSGTLAFGSVTTSYAVLVAWATGGTGRYFEVTNALNVDIYASVQDGSATDQYYVPTGGRIAIPLASFGTLSITRLRVRAIGANAEAGSVYATVVRNY